MSYHRMPFCSYAKVFIGNQKSSERVFRTEALWTVLKFSAYMIYNQYLASAVSAQSVSWLHVWPGVAALI